MATGDVTITIIDGGAAIVVTAASVQAVIGTAETGPTATVVATANPNTLDSVFGVGKLREAGGLAILAGGTVLACRAATVTAGVASAVTAASLGTSVVTVTGTPLDDYFFVFKVVNGGTVGTTGITFQLSLDAGRTYGPVLSLGTAVLYAVSESGVTLNFAAGTLLAAGTAKFGCIGPKPDAAGIVACLSALQASPYANAGWGSGNIADVVSAADAATVSLQLETMATNYVFSRFIMTARDASPAAIWGGTAETESTWIGSLQTAFSATQAKRDCVAGGYYNMPSPFPTPVASAPRYRRPGAWALAVRQVTIPPQRHAGRVRDGALINIVTDPTTDPLDGFIYHDERVNPGLDVARFASFRTRIGYPGWYVQNPNLMSPPGSSFTILPYGNVMDVACGIVHQVGQADINSDIRLNPNGTIYENEALALEAAFLNAINIYMTATQMISSVRVAVDRTNNVLATSTINVSVTIVSRGYISTEIISIGFQNPLTAG